MTKPLEVNVDDNIEKALRDLKKKMAHEGVLREIKKRKYYERSQVRNERERGKSVKGVSCGGRGTPCASGSGAATEAEKTQSGHVSSINTGLPCEGCVAL